MPVKLVLAGAVDGQKLDLLRRAAALHGGSPVMSHRVGGVVVHRATWRDVRAGLEDREVSMHAMAGRPDYRAMEDLLWSGADGLVMAAEREETRFQATWDELMRVAEGLARVGLSVMSMPVALLYLDSGGNGLMEPEELDRRLGVPAGVIPRFAGVEEGLEASIDSVLARLREAGAS